MSQVDDDGDTPCPSMQPGHREAFAAVLLGLVGLTAPDPRYLQLVDPAGPAAEQRAVANESDCILVALGAEELYLACERTEPYENGSAPRLLEERAGGSPMSPGGAMRLATLATPPGTADAIWWGQAGAEPEHVEHVVALRWRGASTIEMDVVAGGQRTPAGAETVRKLTRVATWGGQHFICQQTGRPIIGVVDLEDLVDRLGLRAAAA